MANHGRKKMTVTHALQLIILLAIMSDSESAENDVSLSLADVAEGRSALFIRNEDNPDKNGNRTTRQGLASQAASATDPSSSTPSSSSSMEQTVHNILQWLQGKYTQNNRKARQEFPSRQYLPSLSGADVPTSTQKPRPFQTADVGRRLPPVYEQQTPNEGEGKYEVSKQRPAVEVENLGYPYQEQPTPEFNIPTPTRPRPDLGGGGRLPTTYPTLSPPPPSAPYPRLYPTPGFPTINTPASTLAEQLPKTVAEMPSADNAGLSQSSPDYFLQADKSTTAAAAFDATTTTTTTTTTGNEIDSDASHPPHIHDIHVECSKDRMTIDIEFNRRFDGVIYSKGYYNTPGCRYVSPNSGYTKYTFTVMLNSCGTQFIDEFSEGKQAYLENVLVLQNEIGIQEVWDSVRSVRCLWEGNLNKALSVALSVGMLNQEVVTFSGDTATARLDIQMGRGPFAPLANGLVKIGEPMTLVVTVEGDPTFNVLVRECTARDNDPESGNVVKLTDDDGCILKPKLIGAFQMSRNPDTNSVISYAFFNAFKFPDIMDLTIECNVELCKTECRPCSIADQKTEPGKRRRRRHAEKDDHHISAMENHTKKQSDHLKLSSSPILSHSMIVPRYPIQFSQHSANETKLIQNINIANLRKIIHNQPNSTSEKDVQYRLHRPTENSIDDLFSEIFINVDPIVVNRRFMVYAPGDILTADHDRQVTDDFNPVNNLSQVFVAVESSNENMKICLTPLSYFFVAVVLMTTPVISCVSCIMLWQRGRAKTLF